MSGKFSSLERQPLTALAARTTGGMFSWRRGGAGFAATSAAASPNCADISKREPVVLLDGRPERATARDREVDEEEFLRTEPEPLLWAGSGRGKRFLLTGSCSLRYREATAGVLRNAPGTARTGVVSGNDMVNAGGLGWPFLLLTGCRRAC